MMQHLIGAAQPRVQKGEFVQLLRQMGDGAKKAKVFAKSLYEDYRAKTCDILRAYERFETFSEEATQAFNGGEELPDLSSTEMQLCYDEYREDPEVREAWDQAGVESNLLMRSAMFSPAQASSPSSPAEEKKGKKLKASEIVEMQELMVDKMQVYTQAAIKALTEGAGGANWKAEVAIQMVQALASAAVEHRYGTSAEEMTMAGFRHATTLQKNERFMRATEKQQEILMTLAKQCCPE